MIAIMTVTGPDHTGIIAAVSTALAELKVNILDVSQTIILRVELDDNTTDITAVQERMTTVEEQEQLVIRVQSDALFSTMHEI